MKRRQFVVLSVGGTFLLSGCAENQQPETPDEGSIRVVNQTDSSQGIEVEVADENSEVILSEQYELSPEDSDGSQALESEIVNLNETYSVQSITANHNSNYEWEVSEGTGLLYVGIKDDGLIFDPEPFEG